MSTPPKLAALRVAFIGLGTMGGPMAAHLWRHGARLAVYNRSLTRRLRWAEQHPGADIADYPAAVATAADVLCLCVGGDRDVEELLLSDQGAGLALKAGALVIDHSTISAAQARHCQQRLAERGIAYLDAPVSGGEQGAHAGTLSIMVGGDAESYARAQPVLNAYGRHVQHMGAVGSGQMTKMVNQICVAGLLQGLAEGIHFAQAAGLDHEAVFTALGQGAASSWQMQHRHASMRAADYQHGFAVDWMRKDLGLCLDEARRIGAQLPVTALIDQFFADLQSRGCGRWDMSSLLSRLQKQGDSR